MIQASLNRQISELIDGNENMVTRQISGFIRYAMDEYFCNRRYQKEE